ncbi:MAG: hypothetical protein L0Y80_00055 [Ignavibacteriae bacterium]|nr:hypothetical protein [Ignavibacteriota bacterium]
MMAMNSVRSAFHVDAFKTALPLNSPDFARIIDATHLRLRQVRIPADYADIR